MIARESFGDKRLSPFLPFVSSFSSSIFGQAHVLGGLFGQGGSSNGAKLGLYPIMTSKEDGEFLELSNPEGEMEGDIVKS